MLECSHGALKNKKPAWSKRKEGPDWWPSQMLLYCFIPVSIELESSTSHAAEGLTLSSVFMFCLPLLLLGSKLYWGLCQDINLEDWGCKLGASPLLFCVFMLLNTIYINLSVSFLPVLLDKDGLVVEGCMSVPFLKFCTQFRQAQCYQMGYRALFWGKTLERSVV